MQSVERWFLTDTKMGASTNKGATNAAIAAGIRYHKKLYKTLELHAKMAMPGWKLYVEPWFRTPSYKLRSPDSVLLNSETGQAIVIEVKKNWADGRDVKLIREYLPIVASAFEVATFPLMIVGNLRGLGHDPLLSMRDIPTVLSWTPEQPTPTMLKLL